MPEPVSAIVDSSSEQRPAKVLAITAPVRLRPVAAVVDDAPEVVPVAVMPPSEPEPAAVVAITTRVRPVAAAVVEPVAVAEAIPIAVVPSSKSKPAVVVAITTRVRPVAAVVAEPVLVAVGESVPEADPIEVSSPAWSRPRTFAPLPDRRDEPKPAKPPSHAWRSIG